MFKYFGQYGTNSNCSKVITRIVAKVIDESRSWRAGRPRPRPHVLDGDTAPPTERGTAASTFEIYGRRLCCIIRGPCLLWPNGWMDQDVIWYGARGRPRPRRHCVRWGPISPPQRGTAPNFLPMSVVAKRMDGSRCHLVGR